MDADKEINILRDGKIDKIVLENITPDSLNKLDLSLETDAVKETVAVLKDLINKLKSK
jgi:hypothetical protein